MTPLALDIAIGVIILLSTAVAYMRGLIKEAFTLAGLIIAVFLAYKAGHLLVPEFNRWLDVPEGGTMEVDPENPRLVWGLMSPPLAAKVFAYGGTFLFALFLMMLVGYFVSRWVNEAGLGIVDKITGGAFGFLRGFLLVFLIYVPCTYLLDYKKFPDWALRSFSVPMLQGTLDRLNNAYGLDQKIQSRANGIVIKFDKVDIDKLGDGAPSSAKEELKEAIEREERATGAY